MVDHARDELDHPAWTLLERRKTELLRQEKPLGFAVELTTGDDARFVRGRLGLERARELVVGSPDDFREPALLYMPRTMPDLRVAHLDRSLASTATGSASA